jgi:hypothetical protein
MIEWRDPPRGREKGRDAWLPTRPSTRVASIWRGDSGRVLWTVYLPTAGRTQQNGVAGDWVQARDIVEALVKDHVRRMREIPHDTA